MEGKANWHKVLYKRRNLPDNHDDDTFLERVKRNVNFRHVTRLEAIVGSCRVAQQICAVCLFGIAFVHMDAKNVDEMDVFWATSLASFVGYIVYKMIVGWKRSLWDDLKSLWIFLFAGYGLSPVLKTLTASISTDTIEAMAIMMFITHLIFHNYGLDAAIVSRALSINAAVFASICLASRLPTTTHAFVLLTMAVEFFALWPVLRDQIVERLSNVHQILWTIVLMAASFGAIFVLSSVFSILFLMLMLFVCIICPLWFVSWQTLKENIYGPWDEAVISD